VELSKALSEYLDEATERIIREEVFGDSGKPRNAKSPMDLKKLAGGKTLRQCTLLTEWEAG